MLRAICSAARNDFHFPFRTVAKGEEEEILNIYGNKTVENR